MSLNKFYEMTISPPPPRIPTSNESIPVLLLAPFSSVPKVDFHAVKVGTKMQRDVIIRNPTSGNIIIDLVISPDMLERGFCVNALTFDLSPCSQSKLEIEWNPSTVGQWRDTIRVIHVNGKSKFANIVITSAAVATQSNRVPLQRITQPVGDQFSNVRKVARTNIKSSNFKVKCFSEVPKTLPKQESYIKKEGDDNIKSQRNNENSKDSSENFVVGKLPACDISPIQFHRSTYVKHPGFPPNLHNLPVISAEEEEYEQSCNTIDENVTSCPIKSDDTHISLQSKEFTLELSDLQLSPVGLLINTEQVKSSTSTITVNEEKFERNFERDSLEGPHLQYSVSEENLTRPGTPPLSIRNTDFSCSFNVSPFMKFKKPGYTKIGYLKSANKSQSAGQLTHLVSPPDSILTSTARKKYKLEGGLSSISPKSRVQFKKTPTRLFSNGKANKTNQQIKAKQVNPRCLDTSFTTENALHPLGFYYETTYENPFAKHALHTPAFLEKQSIELIKWLNSVLTPPEELSSVETGVDIEKLWKKSITSDVLLLAPTKDEVCTKYHSDEGRLMAVRKASLALYKSDKVARVLHGILAKVERGFLDVKDDLDLHCDQGVRYKLVQLIMYYNPLWLRIGLETIYNQIIYMPTKDSLGTLICFIKRHLLSDNQIIKKNLYSKNTSYKMPNFRREMNNFIVFKFLSLIFFLDKAKTQRLIPYDPCLFRKSALIKESEGILNEFIKDFIKCVGAQKRTLAALGYTLTHKQTYLEEFNFSVTSFQDLRDGIRLARAMEIILKKTSLSQQLRTPAVSRLQKVHNVKISLEALRNEGYEITEDITANDIVDGYEEKIMSLLWQILHRFLGPRYLRSAIIIQRWWRKILPSVMSNRIMKIEAAIRIQAWWKGVLLRKKLPLITEELRNMKRNRKELIKHATQIQHWYRNIIIMRHDRLRYSLIKQSIIKIQRWFRMNRETRKQVQIYHEKRAACMLIQNWYRSTLEMRRLRENFLNLRYYTIFIQRKFRCLQLTKKLRNQFKATKLACIRIQEWYRGVKNMQKDRNNYQSVRHAAVIIQTRFRGLKEMRKQLILFNSQRNACIKIQSWFRAKLHRNKFIKLKQSTIFIQTMFRNKILARECRKSYLTKKEACIVIQRWYRRKQVMEKERENFLRLRQSVIVIQLRFRSYQETKRAQIEFQSKRNACTKIQLWFRSIALKNRERDAFLQKRYSAIIIQRWYRRAIQLRSERSNFLRIRQSVKIIQEKFRGYQATRKERFEFNNKRIACKKIQLWFRSTLLMRKERIKFLEVKYSAVTIQRWYRGVINMRKEQSLYRQKRDACLKIQNWYRCLNNKLLTEVTFNDSFYIDASENFEIEMKRNSLDIMCEAGLKIFNWWKTKKEASRFKKVKMATITIQRWYRLSKEAKTQRNNFTNLRKACVTIQTWYRKFRELKELGAIAIEDRFAHMTEEEKRQYKAAVVIQACWRGYIWRERNSALIDELRKRSDSVKKGIVEENAGSGNQRLIDLFDYSIKYFTVDDVKFKTFKVLWMTVRKLDFITLHSPVLCEKLANIHSFFVMAWGTLDIQTRSDPYIKVFEHILNILMNLARNDATTSSVHESLIKFNGHRILATLMGKSIAKHSSLFCKCVCLLWIIFSQNHQIANTIKEDKEFTKRLLFYYKQIAKKTSKNKNHARIIPLLVSDWGYKTVCREFLDESAAITELFQVLQVKPPK